MIVQLETQEEGPVEPVGGAGGAVQGGVGRAHSFGRFPYLRQDPRATLGSHETQEWSRAGVGAKRRHRRGSRVLLGAFLVLRIEAPLRLMR